MIKSDFDPNQNYNYAVYSRYSCKVQNDRSPEQQSDEIKRTIRMHGRPWNEVAQPYTDAAMSGKYVRRRPALQRLLKDIKTGRLNVDLILVDTSERFGRADEMAEIRRDLRNHHGVYVLAASTQFIPPTGMVGRLVESGEQARSIAENETKAHMVNRGKRDAVKAGRWPGGPPPTGYRLKLIVDPNARSVRRASYNVLEKDVETSPTIRKVFELAAGGDSTVKIARKLNADVTVPDIRKPINTYWVSSVIRHKVYMGTYEFGRLSREIISDTHVQIKNDPSEYVVVDNYCEPIVDEAMWKAANATLNARKKRKRESSPGSLLKPLVGGIKVTSALPGLIYCSSCGTRMTVQGSGSISQNGNRYRYFSCDRQLVNACDNRTNIEVGALETAVFQILRAKLFPVDGISVPGWFPVFVETVKAHLETKRANSPSDSEAIRLQVKESTRKRDGWFKSLSNPELDDEVRRDIEYQMSKNIAELKKLQSSLSGIEAEERLVLEELDASKVVKRLQQLDDLLRVANPVLLNVELAHHIREISCSADGSVVLNGTHVGLFGDLPMLLHGPRSEKQPSGTESALIGKRAQPRRLTRRSGVDADMGIDSNPVSEDAHQFALDPERYAQLAGQFVWSEEVQIQHRKRKWELLTPKILEFAAQNPQLSCLKSAKQLGVTTWLLRKVFKHSQTAWPLNWEQPEHLRGLRARKTA